MKIIQQKQSGKHDFQATTHLKKKTILPIVIK